MIYCGTVGVKLNRTQRKHLEALCQNFKEVVPMIMMLPFLTALIAIVFTMRGARMPAIIGWGVTFIIFLAWLQYHMTDKLNISL